MAKQNDTQILKSHPLKRKYSSLKKRSLARLSHGHPHHLLHHTYARTMHFLAYLLEEFRPFRSRDIGSTSQGTLPFDTVNVCVGMRESVWNIGARSRRIEGFIFGERTLKRSRWSWTWRAVNKATPWILGDSVGSLRSLSLHIYKIISEFGNKIFSLGTMRLQKVKICLYKKFYLLVIDRGYIKFAIMWNN